MSLAYLEYYIEVVALFIMLQTYRIKLILPKKKKYFGTIFVILIKQSIFFLRITEIYGFRTNRPHFCFIFKKNFDFFDMQIYLTIFAANYIQKAHKQ